MKKLLIPAALVCAVILTAGAAKKPVQDPVLMTINGKEVKLSEFDYLYNKNNKQQAEPQSVADYVDMFVNYKLKVADAEAAGLDTTKQFKKEYEGYCADLARPYLRDSTVEQKLIDEAFSRLPRMLHVGHIMQPLNPAGKAKADSILNLLKQGQNFEELATKFSSDNSSRAKGGDQGWVLACDYPYMFENAVFTTPVGQFSQVIEDAPYGYHIVKVYEEKPNPGEVRASHILLTTRGLSKEEADAKKALADSLYTVLTVGKADFADIAQRFSEDPGSAKRGGDLGFFGPGKMVKPFEDVAFSLEPEQISTPFLSPFGYHIVKVDAHRGVTSKDQQLNLIKTAIGRDVRASMPEEAKIEALKKEYGVVVDEAAVASIEEKIAGSDDPYPLFKDDMTVVAHFGPEEVTAKDIATVLGGYRKGIPFIKAVNLIMSKKTKDKAMDILAQTNTEYRNLTNEYRDGILLFDKSNERVWDKSNTDTKGLEEYFNAHRQNYTWDKPRFKGAIIFANSDSVKNCVASYLGANKVEADSLVNKMREHFGRNVKVERVVTAKGDNKIVDNIAFGGEAATAPGQWVAWLPYDWKIIDAPEEASDVRSAVTNDYQQALEQEWLEELHKKYPVVYNKKEINKLKKRK